MAYTHHSFIACEDCGERHYPGNKEACVETLKIQLEELQVIISDLKRQVEECVKYTERR